MSIPYSVVESVAAVRVMRRSTSEVPDYLTPLNKRGVTPTTAADGPSNT